MQNQGQLPPLQNNFYQNPQNNIQGLPTNTNEYIPLNQPHSYQPQYNQPPQYNQGHYQTPIVQPFQLPLPGNNTQPKPQYNQQPQYYQAPRSPANYQAPKSEPLKFPQPTTDIQQQSNPQNQVQGNPINQDLQPPPLTIQSNQQGLNNEAETNQYDNFPQKYAIFTVIYVFSFCGEVFIQFYLFGYIPTFGLYLFSIIALVLSSLQTCLGIKKRRCYICQLKKCGYILAFLFLAAFLITQIVGFVYAIKYPLRYQMGNAPANDAIADYTDYYNSKYKICNYGSCYNMKEVNKMSETCDVLQQIFGLEFKSKSYATYCIGVQSGTQEDIDYDQFTPLQTGLMVYFAFGSVVALVITFYLGKHLIYYIKILIFQNDFIQEEKERDTYKVYQQQNIKGGSSKYNK